MNIIFKIIFCKCIALSNNRIVMSFLTNAILFPSVSNYRKFINCNRTVYLYANKPFLSTTHEFYK